ncbi:glucan endo-1,3-beta-glucosidase 8-like [Argentina anserina]|uniref:glucan endo-1,3-beta-glucosidase 8-like n=1 Tax=Argentina anserina TaxID=57926 RepID=UPI0021767219|nr:glucan endo-1,3-beta-glucosidase 8-like [Potentilla anserina]
MVRVSILLACFIFIMLVNLTDHVQGLGINWGSMASHPLDPGNVVKMLKDNGIKKVKLFDAEPATMKALSGSGISVIVGIPNDKLASISSAYKHATEWVKENITNYDHNGGVDISYVAVGNEPFLTSYNGTYLKTTFPALQNIQKALDEAGTRQKIKAIVPFNADVYEASSDKPSDGQFRKDIRVEMLKILGLLKSNKSPFFVNIYPFISLQQSSDFPREFAFFDGTNKPVQDNNNQYTNVFDANYDTLVWSLKKVGYQDLDIVIGEAGWPTDGDQNANATLAKKFYDGLLKKLAKGEGTPLRKGYLEVYLFGLTDEDLKSIGPGDFERHWGIFSYDGKPKFPMDLTGKGNDKMLKEVQGVQYMDKKWCVVNSDVRNETILLNDLNYACSQTDCTSLGIGRSCDLNMQGNVSYAFNSFFQSRDQDVRTCNFDGKGTIANTDPSKGTCVFNIQIYSAGLRHQLTFALSIFAGLVLMISLH